jgi:Mg2+ and Co2+ transporter CorA
MEGILEVVDDLKSFASHPLLLPTALYWVYSQILRRDVESVHEKIKQVQIKTGLLKEYLKANTARGSTTTEKRGATNSVQQAPDLTEIHQMIVEQHALLTRGVAEFTEDLGNACYSIFDILERLEEVDRLGNPLPPSWLDGDADLELRKLLTHTQVSTKYELHHREQILSRVKIQQQVLYNLMQSRIGDATLRDSSAMKSIAVLTMVFLPSTALATIFSMGSFFDQSPSNRHIVVSSQFWVFWAISIPITLMVLVTYIFWVEREWLSRLLGFRRKELDEEGGQVDGQALAKSGRPRTLSMVYRSSITKEISG